MSSDIDCIRLHTDGDPFEGRIVGASLGEEHDEYEVVFRPEGAPTLSVGNSVELEWLDDDREHLARTEGTIRRYWRGRDWRRFLVRCAVPPEAPDRQVNRRSATRLPIAPGSAQIAFSSQSWAANDDARLNDISATGFSVVACDDGHELAAGADVVATFELPDLAPLEVVGVVRYRRDMCPYSLYGVEFDAVRTENFPSKQVMILSFVERCRLAELASVQGPAA